MMPTFVPFEREIKQQIMYNVTLGHIRATIFSVVNQLTLHILKVYYSLRYTAGNARALYCHLWPRRLYNIRLNYLINGAIFEESYWALNV